MVAALPSYEEPPICGGCGILADAGRDTCETCKTPYATVRAPVQPARGYWAAVRATFTCNACKFDVPLNHFEFVDAVICTRCGKEQRHDKKAWQRLVEYAQFVGDFGVPGAEGRFPDPEVRLASRPFPNLGRGSVWATDQQMSASPGNPLCKTCKTPVVVERVTEHQLDIACPSCHGNKSYELRNAATYHARGVVADEHEAGVGEVSLLEGRGTSLLGCPRCNAPLEGVQDADGATTCTYCNAPCRISTRTHARAGHKHVPVKTWWLYFDAPCRHRKKLVNEAKQIAGRARKRQARNLSRSANDGEAGRARMFGPIGGTPEQPTPSPAPPEPRVSGGLVAILVLVVLVVGAGVFWYVRHSTPAKSGHSSSSSSPKITPVRSSTAANGSARST